MRLTRIVMPEQARAGETIEIRAIIVHPMITGHTGGVANVNPRRIVHTFTAEYDGAEIFRADFGPGIAANPLVVFTTVATRTADVLFTWIDDTDERTTQRRLLTVTPA